MVQLLMTHGEMCVCEFMPLLRLTQSNVSFHLKALKYAHLITSRKEGRWMLYRLNRTAFERFQAEFESALDPSKWREDADPASRNEATRRRLACQQGQNQLSNITQGGNNNANE
jgi:ArsR family transcriptional regulator